MFIYECEGVCKCGSKNVAKSISDDIGGGGAEVTPSRKVLQWNLARRANSTEETMAGTHTV